MPEKTRFKLSMIITFYLLLLIGLGYVATDLYLPSLPALAVAFEASENDVQMTLFTYLIGFAFSPLLFGPISDHIGRKKVLIAGVLFSILTTTGFFFAPTIQIFSLLRGLQGIATGAVLIAARATVTDLFQGPALAKQMSIMFLSMPLILAAAPTVGGILQEAFGWQSVFLFFLLYLLVALIAVFIKAETNHLLSRATTREVFLRYFSHLQNRSFVIYCVNYALPSLGLMAYLTTSPFLFQEVLGLTPLEYGTLALYTGAVIILTGMINVQLLKRFAPESILSMGSGVVLFSGLLLLAIHLFGTLTKWSLLTPVLFYFTSMPFCVSNAASKSLSTVKSHFGSASAIMTTLQFVIGSIGSFLFTWIADATALPLALLFSLVGLLLFATLFWAKSGRSFV